jgi:acyl-CoA synthetase (AMP-forming)/AMP-acid ligase II
MGMAPLTLDRMLRRHAVERGAKTALRDASTSLSYAMLEHRARQVAQGLLAAGVVPGDRVCYLGKNTLAYFEYFLGAAKVGAVTVPINWRLAPPELAYIVGNARPKMMLVEEPFAPVAAAAAPRLSQLVTGGGSDTFAAWRDSHGDADLQPVADWNQPLLQMYTSGTTGRAKGAVLTHRSLFSLRAQQRALPAWYGWSADDVSLIAMPAAHVSGTGWAIWTLEHGATGIVAREFDPHAVLDQILQHRINKIMMVPTAMQIAVRHPRARGADFSFLEFIYYGGAPLPEALLAECVEVFGCGFVQMYGMTETAGTIVALAPEDHHPARGACTRSVGRALEGVELKVVDDSGSTLPAGSTGEIVTRSSANMLGYFEMPEATAEALDAEGWMRTGDAGYLDTDGYLYLQDRVKDMIISGGENIYPAEVENAIFGHPAVAEVAVVGVPDDKWGESVKAVIVPVAGAARNDADVLAWVAARIARYKVPKSIDWVSALPRNHTGKVLRRVLRDAYRQNARSSKTSVVDSDPT